MRSLAALALLACAGAARRGRGPEVGNLHATALALSPSSTAAPAGEVGNLHATALALSPSSTAAPAGDSPSPATQALDHGGTACQCVCGNRIVWHRELFAGDVKEVKEKECEHDICPYVSIPGLQVTAECIFVKDIRELTAGTVCFCQCGDKAAWVNRAFYGNVTEEKERECIETVCPRVNPLPGLIHRASCQYDRELFTLHRRPKPLPPGATKGGGSRGSGAAPAVLKLLAALAAARGVVAVA